MQKIILSLVVALIATATCFAQNNDAQKSGERIAKLEKLIKKLPGGTGVADLDNLVSELGKGATAAIANSVIIKEASDGNVSAESLVVLGKNVKGEKDALETAAKLTPKAAEGMKSLNPLKIGKAKKAMDFVNEATQILTEESIYQALVIANFGKK